MSSSGSKTAPEADPPATVDIAEEPADPADMDPGAPDPVRVRFFFVVARSRLDLYLTIRRRFREDRSVYVLLDRREHARRSRPSPEHVPERRQQGDRRRRRHYWEDIAHHPAVLIPLSPPQGDDRRIETPAWAGAAESGEEATMERGLVEEARLLAWVQEGQHVIQHVLPAVLDERDVLRSQLHDVSGRCTVLEQENERLRAEVAAGVDRVLAQMSQVLGPMRELADRLATRRRG